MVQVSTLLKEGDLNIPEEFQQRLDTLIQACHRHLPRVDEELIRRAFRVSYWAHRDHRRVTGEPYILHPLEVAFIVAEDISFDDVSVAPRCCTTWSKTPTSRWTSSGKSSARPWASSSTG